jgi:hypothetical protein
MGKFHTEQQVNDRYIQVMGPQLGEQFHALWKRTAWVYDRWETYMALFGHSPERVVFLNSTAPAFFGTVQNVLLVDTLMQIARLTDPPGTPGRFNLTIMGLPALVDLARDKGRTQAACDAALTASGFCRELRNKTLAHNDLEHALGKSATPLPGTSRAKVRRALDAVAYVLNEVSDTYDCGSIVFDHTIQALGGMPSLLQLLELGKKAADEQFESRRKRKQQ